jgi:trehalose 6-phosphate synthase
MAGLARPLPRVVVASHRGPVEFSMEGDVPVARRGSGGLVTALTQLRKELPDGAWVCAAITDGDRSVVSAAGGAPFTDEASGWRLRMLDLDPDAHTRFYSMIANPLLWFIQHSLWSLSDAPDIGHEEHLAWDEGYVPVNAGFADAVIAEVTDEERPPIVMVHDYHLYLVPALVRAKCPETPVHFFCHIPWPNPEAWRVLPARWREALFAGVLGADVVGFQTERSARNFVDGCDQVLGAAVDRWELTVDHGGRRVAARWYPISVDVGYFEALAASDAVRAKASEIAAARREKLILRVDRTDLSKNILRGFRAYDVVLERRPDLRERVTFLCLLQPSRQDVREYADYLEAIRRVVADLNLKHGTPDWQPVDLRLLEDTELVVAAYLQYDVLMVNAIADGMNLVAKEAVVVNASDGVLLLSEGAGAEVELGHFAISVNPFDVEQQASALWDGLTMEAHERRARREACAAVVRRNDLRRWLDAQLTDLLRAREVPGAGG